MAMRVIPPIFSITMYDPLAKENKPRTIAERISHVFQIFINQFKILWQKTYTASDVQTHFSELSIENLRHLKHTQMPLLAIESDKVKAFVQYCFGYCNRIKVRTADQPALCNLLLSIPAAKDVDDYFTRSVIDDRSAVTTFKESLDLVGNKKDSAKAIVNLLTSFQRMPGVINGCFTELSKSPNKEAFLSGLTIEELTEVFEVALRAPADCSFKEDIMTTIVARLKKEPKVVSYFVQAMIAVSRTLANDHIPLAYDQWSKLVQRPSDFLQLLLQAKGDLQKKAAAHIADDWGNFQEKVFKISAHLSMSEIEHMFGVAKDLLSSTSNGTSVIRADLDDFPTAWQAAARVVPSNNPLQCCLLESAKKLFLAGNVVACSNTSEGLSTAENVFRKTLFTQISMGEVLRFKVKLSLYDLRFLSLPKVEEYLTKQPDRSVALFLTFETAAMMALGVKRLEFQNYRELIEVISSHLNQMVFSKKELKQLKEVFCPLKGLLSPLDNTLKDMPKTRAFIDMMGKA